MFNKKQAVPQKSLAVHNCVKHSEAQMKQVTKYNQVRGVRMPEAMWAKVLRTARRTHQTPSDFIRHAIEQKIASVASMQSPALQSGIPTCQTGRVAA